MHIKLAQEPGRITADPTPSLLPVPSLYKTKVYAALLKWLVQVDS